MGEELNILLNIEIVLLFLPTAVLIIGTIVVGIITSRLKRKDKLANQNLNNIENSVDQ